MAGALAFATILGLVLANVVALEDDKGKCGDKKQKSRNCAQQSYKSTTASSANACCARCNKDSKCKQWTYHSFSRKCDLTEYHEDPSPGFMSTCGIKAAPPVPTPPPTPSPPTPPTPPAPPGAQAQWAIIAAGSAGYSNYRHQADACHAYQVMKKSGIPEDHIILMMEDDIANSKENPFKGKMYNKPGNDSPDVYDGCRIAYKGSKVTAKLFMSVLTGDESGVPDGGPVLKSGPSDRVFVNFVDHGGVGIVAFPHGPTLHVKDLSATLKTMKSKNMFKDLVFYMEACESGSMFPGLSADDGIFAVTASNAKESSWGWYCGQKGMGSDETHGKLMHTCLGDLFSISWMEDADTDLSHTIKQQVASVTKRVNKSHVQTFGDKSFEDTQIGKFELAVSDPFVAAKPDESDADGMDVRDIPLKMAFAKWNYATNEIEKMAAWKDLVKVVENRKADEELFQRIVDQACGRADDKLTCAQRLKESHLAIVDQDCHKDLVNVVHEHCPRRESHNPGGWNGFNTKFSQTLVNICETFMGLRKSEVSALVRAECESETQRVSASDTAAVVV